MLRGRVSFGVMCFVVVVLGIPFQGPVRASQAALENLPEELSQRICLYNPVSMRSLDKAWALRVRDHAKKLWVVLRSAGDVAAYPSTRTPYAIANLQIFFLTVPLVGKLFGDSVLDLQKLDIFQGKISEISPIVKSCRNLRSLSLQECKWISQARGLDTLPCLEELNVQGTSIENFHDIRRINSLKILYLNRQLSSLAVDIQKQRPFLRLVVDVDADII